MTGIKTTATADIANDSINYREPGEFGEGANLTSKEPQPVGDLSSQIVGALKESVKADRDQYDSLTRVLHAAYAQASSGKDKARHNARNISFDRQPIMEIGRMCGLGYPTGQAQKKTQEAVSMFNRGEPDRAEAELLGAINYLAAAVLLIRETK